MTSNSQKEEKLIYPTQSWTSVFKGAKNAMVRLNGLDSYKIYMAMAAYSGTKIL